MSESADENWYHETRDCCKSVCNCDQSAGKIWSNVDVVGQKTAVHSSDASDSDCHENHRQKTIATDVGNSEQAKHWHERCY